ncbi:MAG: hypothetical protein WDN44_11930 [Sphingomonas sp.]
MKQIAPTQATSSAKVFAAALEMCSPAMISSVIPSRFDAPLRM